MPAKTPKFSRTEKAAKNDRLTKWDLIAAIAEDADEARLPITGAESVVAARAALDAAGNEYADATVRTLCLVAKFDHESTAAQRKVWRSYGWSLLGEVAKSGWSQEQAAEFLGGERRSWDDIRRAVRSTKRPNIGADTAASFDDRCADWVQRANKLLMDGSKLVEEADTAYHLGSHARFVVMLMQRFSESHIDTELRQILETEAAE